MVDFFRERQWDLVGRRNYWFAISLVLTILGIVFLIRNQVTMGQPLKLGIDFTAGGQLAYQVERPFTPQEVSPTLTAIRREVSAAGIEAEIQVAGPGIGPKNQVLLRTKTAATTADAMNAEIRDQSEKILEILKQRYPGAELISTEMVGPIISRELVVNAVLAVVAGLALVLLWIIIRYDFKFATCAIVALAHDVFILLGVFALLQKEINTPFVAVVLTVVGYSVHDTVVLFDRIRENLRLRKGATFAETTNISLLETMARSVNTVLTVLFTVVALYLLGGVTLRDFALGLIVGMTSGAYSSIFNASQLLTVWKEREERRRPAAARPRPAPVARPAPAAPRELEAASVEKEGQEEAEQEPALIRAPTREPSPAGRARARRKKKTGKRKRRF